MIRHDREVILIRNVPVRTQDVIDIQNEFDAQLFDESVFHDNAKKIACASVIHQLDTVYNRFERSQGRPPDQVDIGDGAWVYIPVPLFNDANIISVRTKDKPAGMIAWFRRKKIYAQSRRNNRLN